VRVFKLKKGGETENARELLIVLTRDIDDELLTKAINICAEKEFDINQTKIYLELQFNCIDFVENDDLKTFYC